MPTAISLTADLQDGIWLGLANGDLARYRQGKLETFPFRRGQDSRVYQIVTNADGSVLGATQSGLIGWKNGMLLTMNVKNGLPCDVLYGLISDTQGALWLYAQCGLVKIENTEMQKWWEHQEAGLKVKVFDVFDGARPSAGSFQPTTSLLPTDVCGSQIKMSCS